MGFRVLWGLLGAVVLHSSEGVFLEVEHLLVDVRSCCSGQSLVVVSSLASCHDGYGDKVGLGMRTQKF